MNHGKPRGKGYKIDDILKTVRPLEPGEQRALVKMARQELNKAKRCRERAGWYDTENPATAQRLREDGKKAHDRGMRITEHLMNWGTVTRPAGPRLAR